MGLSFLVFVSNWLYVSRYRSSGMDCDLKLNEGIPGEVPVSRFAKN
jgi:hypothetical protein